MELLCPPTPSTLAILRVGWSPCCSPVDVDLASVPLWSPASPPIAALHLTKKEDAKRQSRSNFWDCCFRCDPGEK